MSSARNFSIRVRQVFVHPTPYIGVPQALAGLRVASAALADAEQEAGR